MSRQDDRARAKRARESLDALMDSVRDCMAELDALNADSEQGVDELTDAAYGTVLSITTRALDAVAGGKQLASLNPHISQIMTVAVAYRIGRAAGYAEGEADGARLAEQQLAKLAERN